MHAVAWKINDLYGVVTARCGNVYKNCSICDDESSYHQMNSSLPCPDVKCGAHYVSEGWQLLAKSTAAAIQDALTQQSYTTVVV